jgi:transposase
MSLHADPLPEIPVRTAELVRTVLPKGNTITQLRDCFGAVYHDDQFRALYPTRGQPAYAPWRLALVTVFQFLEHLSDRQAAEHVRTRLDWKFALALELEDLGFHYSVLSEFRARLVTADQGEVLFNTFLQVCKDHDLLKAGRQRTDSTHVLARMRVLNRLELIGETLRAALDDLATIIPDALCRVAPSAWWTRYGRRIEEGNLPHSEPARAALAQTIGEDGFFLMTSLFNDPDLDTLLDRPAVEALRRVWLQQFQREDSGQGSIQIKLRLQEDTPPAESRWCTPHEREARTGIKRKTRWQGYKVHFTECCDDAAPRLITHVKTTVATQPDVQVNDTIQTELMARELQPAVHLVDAGYMSGDGLVESQVRGIDLVGPVRESSSWQSRTVDAFDLVAFDIDWDRQHVTCPKGQVSTMWSERSLSWTRRPAIRVKFSTSDCHACPVQVRCTRAKSGVRTLGFPDRTTFEALQTARERVHQAEFRLMYKDRAGIESTMSQGVRRFGVRVARYRGKAKVALQESFAATAINVERATQWLSGSRPAGTYRTQFARLHPTH